MYFMNPNDSTNVVTASTTEKAAARLAVSYTHLTLPTTPYV